MATADEYVIRDASTGEYLLAYDPDFQPEGLEHLLMSGKAEWTTDVHQALGFASFAEASAFYVQQSTKVPLREDGKPNRPLRAKTVSVERGTRALPTRSRAADSKREL